MTIQRTVTVLIPSFHPGGAEKVGVNLANGFAGQGHQVDLVAISPSGPYRELVEPKVRVIDLEASRVRYAIRALRTYIKSERPGHLLSVIRRTNICAAFASVGVEDPPHLHFREANPLQELSHGSGLGLLLSAALMRLTYVKATTIIANSEATKNDLIRYGAVSDPARVVVIGNPVLPAEHEALSRQPPSHPWLRDPNLKVVLNVAGLRFQKDQKLLIEAYRQVADIVPEARLMILGEGPEKAGLERLIVESGIEDRVVLHPVVGNPYPFYANAAVFVLSSRWEGFGNVIIEALSTGTPVVSTDCPGAPAWLLGNGRFGRLVPVGDSREMAAAILDVLRAQSRPDHLIARAKQFTVQRVTEEYAQEMGLPPSERTAGLPAT